MSEPSEELRKLLCEISDKYQISMADQMRITQALWANNKALLVPSDAATEQGAKE